MEKLFALLIAVFLAVFGAASAQATTYPANAPSGAHYAKGAGEPVCTYTGATTVSVRYRYPGGGEHQRGRAPGRDLHVHRRVPEPRLEEQGRRPVHRVRTTTSTATSARRGTAGWMSVLVGLRDDE